MLQILYLNLFVDHNVTRREIKVTWNVIIAGKFDDCILPKTDNVYNETDEG